MNQSFYQVCKIEALVGSISFARPCTAASRTAATAPVIVVNGQRWEAAEGTDYVADADVVRVEIANADTMRAEGVAITFRTFS